MLIYFPWFQGALTRSFHAGEPVEFLAMPAIMLPAKFRQKQGNDERPLKRKNLIRRIEVLP
jgi:hypothetical protein